MVGSMVTLVFDYIMDLLANSAQSATEFGRDGFHEAKLKNMRLLNELRNALNLRVTGCEQIDNSTLMHCSLEAIQVVKRYLSSKGWEQLNFQQKEIISAGIISLMDENHPTCTFYRGRVKELLIQAFQHEGKVPFLIPPDLDAIGPIVQNTVFKLTQIITYNRAVFDILYEDIFSGDNVPPRFYPKKLGTVLLDANEAEAPQEIDEGISSFLKKLRTVEENTIIYKRAVDSENNSVLPSLENLPGFAKGWEDEVSQLRKGFCQREGSHPKNHMMRQESNDRFNISKAIRVKHLPLYTKNGERIIYSRNRGRQFDRPEVAEAFNEISDFFSSGRVQADED